jgi:hypothetical protein
MLQAVYSDKYKVFAATNYGFSRISIINVQDNVLIRKEILPKYCSVSRMFFVNQWLFVMWQSRDGLKNIYAINVLTGAVVKTSSDDFYRFFGKFGENVLFIGRSKQGQSFNCLFCLHSGSFSMHNTDLMCLYPTFRDNAGSVDYYSLYNEEKRQQCVYQYAFSEHIPCFQSIIDGGRKVVTLLESEYAVYGRKHFTIKRDDEIQPKLYSYSGLKYDIEIPDCYGNVELTQRMHAIVDSDDGQHYLILYARKYFTGNNHVFYWCYRIQDDSCTLQWHHRLPCYDGETASCILTGSQLFHGSTFFKYPMPEDAHLAGKLHVLTYDTGELNSIDDHQECVIAGVREGNHDNGNFFVPNYKSNVYFTSNLSSVSMYSLL